MKLLLLRKYIREMLGLFEDKEDKEPDNLLTEPDDVDDPDKKKEVNAVGAAGGTTIRGAMATGPIKKKKRKPIYGKVTSDDRKNS
jgi:hypothetical protein